jgi:hypothetical protein
MYIYIIYLHFGLLRAKICLPNIVSIILVFIVRSEYFVYKNSYVTQ